MTAKTLELRATMSLARLLLSPSHHDEARAMLAEVYNSLTEDLETRDPKDAKELLAELRAYQGLATTVLR